MHQPERGVAVGHRGRDDAHRAQVEHLLEGELLALHLPMDAVDVLGAAVDLGRDAGGAQHLLQRPAQLGDVALAVGALFGQRGGDAPVVVGLQEAERQVLQLPLELPQSEAIGERREYLARLQRQPFARGGVAILGGIQLHQLSRQPRQHQARIADHRQQHLAQRLGLRRLQVMRGGRDRRTGGCRRSAASSRASALTPGPKCSSISRASSDPAAKAACASSAAASTRVLGQRRDDDGGFAGLFDGRRAPRPSPRAWRHAHRSKLEFRRTGMEVMHGFVVRAAAPA